MSNIYGETIDGLVINGRSIKGGVFDERRVQAAAGITLVLGAVAFVYAYFGKEYVPIKTVTTFFFVEFFVRVAFGIQYSPVGIVAKWLTQSRTPLWVSARPKRFAWSMGLVLSLAMMIITNVNIRGGLPLSICLLCMTLMWLEAVLGLCLGCEIYRLLVRRGWMGRDDTYEVCSNGACELDEPERERVPVSSTAVPG
ncbi:MAG: DUF4395 domain-containing protein [Gallionella sp.]